MKSCFFFLIFFLSYLNLNHVLFDVDKKGGEKNNIKGEKEKRNNVL